MLYLLQLCGAILWFVLAPIIGVAVIAFNFVMLVVHPFGEPFGPTPDYVARSLESAFLALSAYILTRMLFPSK